MINNDRLITIKEAASLLSVHWQTIRNFLKEGKLSYSKIGKNIRILESDLSALVSKNQQKSKKYELEIRFHTDDRKKIEEKLLKIGAKVNYHGHIIDHWLVPLSVKNIEEKNDLFESGMGFGLRIREQDNGYTGKITTSIEVKRLITPYKHEACIEQEIEVENYAEALSLLSAMDQKEFATVDKDRLVYKYKDYKIAIDDIRNFKVGIEIEILTDKKPDELLLNMKNLAKLIGLDPKKDITDKSVTYLYMQEFAKF